jgi:hypothetical protein
MIVGDLLDPKVLGYDAIDLKTLLQEAGYVMPQGSVAKLPRIPGEVQAQIDAIKADREAYADLEEHETFFCPYCNENNGSSWRKEVATGIEFLACGNCYKVVEVR